MEEVAVTSVPSGLSVSHWLKCAVGQKTLRVGQAQLAQAS